MPTHQSCLLPWGPPFTPHCQPTLPSFRWLPSLLRAGNFMPPCCHQPGRTCRGLHLAQHPPTGLTSSQWDGLEAEPRAHHPGLGAASPTPLCGVQRCFSLAFLHPAARTNPTLRPCLTFAILSQPHKHLVAWICPSPVVALMAHSSPVLAGLGPDPDRGQHRAEPQLSIISLPPTQIRDPAASRISSLLGCCQPD